MTFADDLDEIDLGLLDLINYVRRYGVHPNQVKRLLDQRLDEIFDVSDVYDDTINGCFAAYIDPRNLNH